MSDADEVRERWKAPPPKPFKRAQWGRVMELEAAWRSTKFYRPPYDGGMPEWAVDRNTWLIASMYDAIHVFANTLNVMLEEAQTVRALFEERQALAARRAKRAKERRSNRQHERDRRKGR